MYPSYTYTLYQNIHQDNVPELVIYAMNVTTFVVVGSYLVILEPVIHTYVIAVPTVMFNNHEWPRLQTCHDHLIKRS